jgi:alkyldihydroxyacetonephosphate synthase
MKRWQGWGNTQTHYPLPDSAREYLKNVLGPLSIIPSADLESILSRVPESALDQHDLIDARAETRLRYARGQSLPDWLALSHNTISIFPDGVAFPERSSDISDLLAYARHKGAEVIPYGGGTSVVGHINPLLKDRPTLTISLERLNQLIDFDEESHLAEFGAGITGPALENALEKFGFTLGHFPQSFEYSTLGGWIASRSSGQQSYYYGRIENLFAGGEVLTPRGKLELPTYPASAAGPDLREWVLGSEGRFGIISKAVVRVRPRPQQEGFYGVFFPTWESGSDAVRSITQAAIPVSMLRLSNPIETETTLILSGKSWIDLADRGLRLIGQGDQRCLLIFGVTGSPQLTALARRRTRAICRSFGGVFVGQIVGHTWEKSRFYSPYLRNTLWDAGVAIDTLETALPWSQVREAARAIPGAISAAISDFDEKALVMTHLSHIYHDGASIYTTFLFRRTEDPDQLLERWAAMKGAASQVIQDFGGTITHQHGVGVDHKRYLPKEKGPLGLEAIQNAAKLFDPDGLLNPGKLFDR